MDRCVRVGANQSAAGNRMNNEPTRIVEVTLDADFYRVTFYGNLYIVRKIKNTGIGEIELIPDPAKLEEVVRAIE